MRPSPRRHQRWRPRPSTQISPLFGRSWPWISRSSVVLPEPLGPVTSRISPGVTERLMLVSTGVLPKSLETWVSLTTGLGASAAVGARPVRRRHPVGGPRAFGGCRLDSHPFPPTRLVEAGDGQEALSEQSYGNNLPPRPEGSAACQSERGAAATAIVKPPPDGVAETSRPPSLSGVTDRSSRGRRARSPPR